MLSFYSPGVGSASKLRDFDDWQDPRVSTTDDDLISPYSDSSTNDLDQQVRPHELTKSGTYVIRRGRKKERKQLLPKSSSKSLHEERSGKRLKEVRQYSNTFDNIKSLLKENSKLDGLSEPPAEFANAQAVSQPDLVHAIPSSERVNKRDSITDKPLPPSPVDEDNPQVEESVENEMESRQKQPVKITSFAEKTNECNGITITTSKSLDVSKAASLVVDELSARRSMNEHHHTRLESKIPMNLHAEDQIVKKAISENRRPIEIPRDALREIENVKNTAEYAEHKRSWARNGDSRLSASSKRKSFDSDSCDRRLHDVSAFDSRQPRRPQYPPPPQPPPHATDLTDGAKTEHDFDRRKLNGADIYASGRRTRPGDLESHKNDTKQIENVIDAILEDSKNPDFQVLIYYPTESLILLLNLLLFYLMTFVLHVSLPTSE